MSPADDAASVPPTVTMAAAARSERHAPTPMGPVAAVTFVASLSTGVLWNGIAFVAESGYGYGPRASFALSAAFGLAYIAAAFASGSLTRALERRMAPRTLLGWLFLLQAIVAPLVLLPVGSWSMWVVGCTASALSAVQWPIIESYLGGGRSRAGMRSVIGWWNVVWMSAVALAVIGLGPFLVRDRATWAIASLVPVSLLCLGISRLLPLVPAPHGDDSSDPVPAIYRPLLTTARILLPIGYVVVGAISPLLPFLLGGLGAPLSLRPALAATWLAARVASVLLLARTNGWQGRWWTLLAAALLMFGGFGLAVLAPSLWLVALGLAAFGFGQGISYYAALYYALAVGNSEVDAAGVHEGLIGIGYALGPMLGVLAFTVAASDRGANVLFVVLVWSTIAAVAGPGLGPFRRWRRRTRVASVPSVE